MKLGMIARMDNSGLGVQTWEAFRHLAPTKTMVIDFRAYRDLQQFPERYRTTSEVTFLKTIPTPQEVDRFLEGLDVVFACETSYSYYLLTKARSLGIATIIQPNYEFAGWVNNKTLPRPDAFGLPSMWHFKDFPNPKILLPVPIATDRFNPNQSTSARRFLHVVGSPAANDRNGTNDLIAALEFVTNDITVNFTCQNDIYVRHMLEGRKVPRNVRTVVSTVKPPNYWSLYEGHDVLIMPRRYGGLSLPINEALGAGMPVIAPGISPNNQWLPEEWLVPTVSTFSFKPGRMGNTIDVHTVDSQKLAAKIDEFVSNPQFYKQGVHKANQLAQANSWDTLKKLYLDTFETIIKA